MPMYSEHLPTRVPEFLQDDETQLYEYLEACGEIFDQFSDTIKEQDAYKDYKKVPEARLSLLARRFAFNPPNNIPDNLLRGIVKDLAKIYTTKGVENSLTWVFRLIGWSSTIEYAWLLNPERYDPTTRVVYPELYERDGLENDAASFNTFFMEMGQGYRIGLQNQQFVDNPSFIVDGYPLIGRNYLVSLLGDSNPYVKSLERVDIDYDKIGYKNFVYGNAVDTPTGTFFDGRTYFSRNNNINKAKIVGEIYQEQNIVKYNPSVISTPYIVVKVDSEDYDKFSRPYVDDNGVLYNYTDREKFRVAQTIIEYMLYEFVRPANIKIILVVSVYEDIDVLPIDDTVELTSNAVSVSNEEEFNTTEYDASYVEVPQYYIGSDGLFVGMTSYIYDSGMLPLSPPTIGGNTRLIVQEESPEFLYEYINMSLTDIGGGMFESSAMLWVRTPSVVSITTPESVSIYGKRLSSSSGWEWIQDITAGTNEYRVFDYTLLKITNYSDGDVILSDGLFDINATVTWEDKKRAKDVQWDYQNPAVYPIIAS